MLKLAAFADEISPDPTEQIRVCKENGIAAIELRGIEGTNVLDLTTDQRTRFRSMLADAGLSVAVVGSPIGKVKIDESFETHLERFRIALDSAAFFSAPMVRLFSYYPPQSGQDMSVYRQEVIRRMRIKVELARGTGVTLVHENEKDIYGETCSRCLDLMTTIDAPEFRTAFDFANFVQANEDPAANWPSLKPYTVHIHIKDAVAGSGKVVPAGQGDGKIAPILKDAFASGYRGYLSLEPHLAAAGQFSGFSGPDLFKTAADAIKKVCSEAGVPLALA